MQPTQPKINQKQLLRFAIGLFLLAALVLAFWWFKLRESDPNGYGSMDTVGWISAIETTGDGTHAVIFKGDLAGTVVRQPTVSAGTEDRDIAWRPDGNYLFFASNRRKSKFSMFRWFPDGKAEPEMRSYEGLAQLSPFFLQEDAEKHAEAQGLDIVAGRVMQYDPKTPAIRQVLPPPDPKLTQSSDPENGNVSPFETMYQKFGTSFRTAKWTPDKKAIFAIMEREDGELLIYQKLDFKTPQEGAPRALVQGDRVDFDVDQTSGAVYFSVENFQWPLGNTPPEFVKDGKETVPYRHAIGVIDFSQPQPLAMIRISKDDKECFGSLAVSPQGDKLVTVTGTYTGNGNMTSNGLLLTLLTGPGKGQMQPLPLGEVFEPAWSPDGKKIAYARRESKTSRPIYVLEEGSSGPQRVSPDTGVFGHPVFSPQMSKQ